MEMKTCSACKREFPLDTFKLNTKTGYRPTQCVECRRESNRRSYMKHREKRMAWNADYTKRNKEKTGAYSKTWQEKRRDEGYFRTPEKRAYRREYMKQQKRDVMGHYGGTVCACCGENELAFLCLDHKNGDGAEHRRTLEGTSGQKHMYLWAKQNGYPPIFQVLCASCNLGRHVNGGVCPHEIARQGLLGLDSSACVVSEKPRTVC